MSKAWTQTYTGQAFDLLEPDPLTVDIRDIAHAISQTCRYTGHTRHHYSVAEHSTLIAQYLFPLHGPDIAMDGLLHDASEAYVGDISRPVQMALGPEARGELKNLHHKVTVAVYVALGVPASVPIYSKPVQYADTQIILTERAALLTEPPPRAWAITGEPLPVTVLGLPASRARAEWLAVFDHLMGMLYGR